MQNHVVAVQQSPTQHPLMFHGLEQQRLLPDVWLLIKCEGGELSCGEIAGFGVRERGIDGRQGLANTAVMH